MHAPIELEQRRIKEADDIARHVTVGIRDCYLHIAKSLQKPKVEQRRKRGLEQVVDAVARDGPGVWRVR